MLQQSVQCARMPPSPTVQANCRPRRPGRPHARHGQKEASLGYTCSEQGSSAWLTSLLVSMAGKELSKPLMSSPPAGAWLKPPPKRSSSPSSTVAVRSFSEANWSASSPRSARSRERKSSVLSASPTRSKFVASPRASVWPGGYVFSTGCGAASGVQWRSSPASISSSEGKRSAIVHVQGAAGVAERGGDGIGRRLFCFQVL